MHTINIYFVAIYYINKINVNYMYLPRNVLIATGKLSLLLVKTPLCTLPNVPMHKTNGATS